MSLNGQKNRYSCSSCKQHTAYSYTHIIFAQINDVNKTDRNELKELHLRLLLLQVSLKTENDMLDSGPRSPWYNCLIP